VKTTLDHRGPDKPVFPQSYLIIILCNNCYAIPVEYSNFPDEWKWKVKTTTDKQGKQHGWRVRTAEGQRPSPPRHGSIDYHPMAGFQNSTGVWWHRGPMTVFPGHTGGMVALSGGIIPGESISGGTKSTGRATAYPRLEHGLAQ
jgi:hypothetical protein